MQSISVISLLDSETEWLPAGLCTHMDVLPPTQCVLPALFSLLLGSLFFSKVSFWSTASFPTSQLNLYFALPWLHCCILWALKNLGCVAHVVHTGRQMTLLCPCIVSVRSFLSVLRTQSSFRLRIQISFCHWHILGFSSLQSKTLNPN